jgi:hypothetical protein
VQSFADVNALLAGNGGAPAILPFGTGLGFDVAGLAIATPNVSQVPEPGTWAMMLLGFAGIGVAARRKRSPAQLRHA